eukprot:2742826-Rhodomonas_salina.2
MAAHLRSNSSCLGLRSAFIASNTPLNLAGASHPRATASRSLASSMPWRRRALCRSTGTRL